MTPIKPISVVKRMTQNQGFSLVEVLVALLVLSIGLLGLAALQTTSLQYNTGSYFRTQATFFAYDIIDRMRANSTAVADGGSYDIATAAAATPFLTSTDPACDTSSCNTANMAAYDLGKWYKRMSQVLPGASTNLATIDINASEMVTITIRWTERDLSMSQTWAVQL
jgi:type IV pilus assembly protein PilV